MVLIIMKYLLVALFLSGLAVLTARQLFTLPVVAEGVNTTALPPSEVGPLANALEPQSKNQNGLTGIAPLRNGADAFAARFLLAEAAVSSIDVQYYIWRNDMTGYLLLDALRRAADRGVRVRMLLDDHGIPGLDPGLAAIDAHPNVEVRLYNPFNLRRFKNLSFAFDFFRLNRRMHNKSFTVDGRASILGGRNIGDEYFHTGTTALQIDLDVLAVGDIVPRISEDFDRYWAAKSVHPAGPIVGEPDDDDPISAALADFEGLAQLADYHSLLRSSDIVATLAAGNLSLEWTRVVLISDDPIKGEGAVPREGLLATRLMQAVGEIKTRFDGVTPYFVPGAAGVSAFATLQEKGVTVRMLTNSLEATNVLPVHAGYAKRREAMLRAGVGLFELRRQAEAKIKADTFGPFGSSGSSLHAKTFAVDGARIFVGSFNFDPRSTTLNTEMGLLIESEQMAMTMHTAFDRSLSGLAWRVEMQDGNLIWIDPATEAATGDEPGTSALKRLGLTVIGWLPVEWLL